MKITKRSSERKLLISIGAVLIVASSAVATYFTLRHFNPPHTTALSSQLARSSPRQHPKKKLPTARNLQRQLRRALLCQTLRRSPPALSTVPMTLISGKLLTNLEPSPILATSPATSASSACRHYPAAARMSAHSALCSCLIWRN